MHEQTHTSRLQDQELARLQRGAQTRAAAAVKQEISCARAADVLPYVEAARRAGAKTLRELAAALTARGVPAPAGGRAWHPMQVKRVVDANRG